MKRYGSTLFPAWCFLACLLAGFVCFRTEAASFKDIAQGKLGKVDAAADRYEYIGNNILAIGHVVIRFQGMELTADRAVINPETEDIEMAGNVLFFQQKSKQSQVTLDEYNALLQNPRVRVRLIEYITAPTGEQKLLIEETRNETAMRAERIAGSLKTGILQFRNFSMKSGVLFCHGEEAERTFDGKITVQRARFTTCEYLEDDREHYAVYAKKATISPRRAHRGLFNYNPDQGEHSVWAFNDFIEIYGIPVLWLPVLHKPRDLSSFGGRIEFGSSSSWGYYIRTAKNFQLMDEPYLNANLMLDLYSARGFGYGASLDFMTPESATEAFFYGIQDRDPYNYWNGKKSSATWAKNNSRLKIPGYRYEFRLTNMTHILPNLDFRGQVDVLSDYNFLNEFFGSRYRSVLEPPTFASLEYQAERFTASAYGTVRVNSFFSTVQRIPELRIDFQRQELFRNIYYQGETSFDYLSMKWRDFDRPRTHPELGLNKDYETFRLDSLHMFYYPMKFLNINIIPRAGFRLTAYSRTSDNKITYEDLDRMFSADAVDGQPTVLVRNYDASGGSKIRFTGEIGVEANTKFYRAWQDVKNAYWQLDGLRHVMQPYVNYTYIPRPTVSADHLYYFDEIDRIEEQNVIRLGLINRLQTRRNNQIQELVSLEHYWDYYFHRAKGFNSFGDLGTIFRFNPFPGLSFTSELLLDLGQNNDHKTEAKRGSKYAGRPGVSWKLINRWYNQLRWQFAPRWSIYGSYKYSDQYDQRTPYSMGTMFSSITATSMFLTRFKRSQQFSAGLDFPVLFDKHMDGSIGCTYDVDSALMKDAFLRLKRQFHCVVVEARAGLSEKRGGSDGGKSCSYYFSFMVGLTALPGFGIGQPSN